MTASDRIEELKKRYDENPRRFFAPLANEYRKAGDLDQAIALCQTHLAEQPSNMNGHVVYGQALYEAARYDEAKTTFEAALTLDPENLIALRHLGDIACANGANLEARDWYERVLYADPRNDEIIALLAHLAAEEKKPSSAASLASPESLAPREAREDFTPPRVITPASRTPVSDPTPIIPIEAVTTVRAPAVAASFATPISPPPVVAPPLSAPVAAPPAVPSIAAGELDDVFLDVEEVHFSTPADSLPAVPAWPARAEGAESFVAQSDLVMDPFAELEPAPVPAPELLVEREPQPLPAAEMSEHAKPEPPAEPFVTETMAELYLQQGFTAEALEVYRQLSAASPDDKALADRVWRLERGEPTAGAPGRAPAVEAEPEAAIEPAPVSEGVVESSATADFVIDSESVPDFAPDFEADVAFDVAPDAAVADSVVDTTSQPAPFAPPDAAPETFSMSPSARSYFAALAGRRAVQGNGRARATPRSTTPHVSAPALTASLFSNGRAESLDELFAGGTIPPEDERLALTLAQVAGAAEMGGASVKGKPTSAAATELSLDAVFREAEPRGTGSVARQSETLRFDQFFAAAGDDSAAQQAAASAPAGEPGSPAELQQFQSWLTRLKQP